MRHLCVRPGLILGIGLVLVCAGCADSEEAAQVELEVVVDGTGMAPATNELGWTVEVTAFELVVQDLEFSVEGEVHAASWLRRLEGLVVQEAHAHPGHLAGGEVTGELAGLFRVDFMEDGASLGRATLLPGSYHGGNFGFSRAEGSDALGGHTAWIEGTATREGAAIHFTALLDVDPSAKLVGAPLELEVAEGSSARLGLRLDLTDPEEGDTLFQRLDFGALDEDGDGEVTIQPGDAAHNVLRRTLQDHDHYEISVR